MASAVLAVAPVAATPATTRDTPAFPADLPPMSVATPDDPKAGVSIHPFVANALDRRDVVRTVEMGEPGGDTYVEHVPRAFGLTLHSPL